MSTGDDASSRDDFLWVNHSANTRGSMPPRHTIFSHVQSNRRAQKLRDTAKTLRASALKGRTAALHDPRLQILQSGGARNKRKPAQEAQAPAASAAGHKIEHSPTKSRGQVVTPLSPTSILQNGNSDPFHAYPINIGPEENMLLKLYRETVIPTVYFLDFKNTRINDKYLANMANQDWQDNIKGLEDKGTALGTLARYSAIAARSNPHMQHLALKYTCLSTQVLRDKVSRNQDLTEVSTCLHINMLFNADIVGQNLPGALAHSRVFRHIFQQQWKQGQLDFKMLLYQLHNDMQLTSTFLVRPAFDEGDWLTTILKPLWDAAAAYLPAYPEPDDALDPAIDNKVLQHWFRQRRSIFRHGGLNAANGVTPPTALVSSSRKFFDRFKCVHC
jgi:hypothetical protein